MKTGWIDRAKLHLVAAHLVVVQALEPAAKVFGAEAGGAVGGAAGVFEDLLGDEDGAVRTERESDGVGGARIEGDDFPALIHPYGGMECVFAKVTNDDSRDSRVEAVDNGPQKVVRHGARCGGFFDFESDGVGLKEAHPDRKNHFAGEVVEDDDGLTSGGIHHEAADANFDLRLGSLGVGFGFEAGQVHG
jgi:hypothetical protein